MKIASSSVAVPAAVALIFGNLFAIESARAGGGDVAAGLLGGFAAGAIIGSAMAPRPYYDPAPAYAPPLPAYVAPVYDTPVCFWARGEPVWNGYTWIRPRVQVCE